MALSRDRTGMTPDKTPDWKPDSVRVPPGSQVVTATLSDQGIVKNVIRLTQAQYDALSVKDPETLYMIVG